MTERSTMSWNSLCRKSAAAVTATLFDGNEEVFLKGPSFVFVSSLLRRCSRLVFDLVVVSVVVVVLVVTVVVVVAVVVDVVVVVVVHVVVVWPSRAV